MNDIKQKTAQVALALLNQGRMRRGKYATGTADGFNGLFHFRIAGVPVQVHSTDSDPPAWRHVVVTLGSSTMVPSWNVVNRVRDLFFGPDSWVTVYLTPNDGPIQFQPGSIHLWQPLLEGLIVPHPETGFTKVNPQDKRFFSRPSVAGRIRNFAEKGIYRLAACARKAVRSPETELETKVPSLD